MTRLGAGPYGAGPRPLEIECLRLRVQDPDCARVSTVKACVDGAVILLV
jgi:hypothetical protein